jgi:hypothetical protein
MIDDNNNRNELRCTLMNDAMIIKIINNGRKMIKPKNDKEIEAMKASIKSFQLICDLISIFKIGVHTDTVTIVSKNEAT